VDEQSVKQFLSDLGLGEIRYFDRIGSTNDAALAWAAEGAPDLALVIADEQTAGRGRAGRKWYTPTGAALAFSLILLPLPDEGEAIPMFTALGALAVTQMLREKHGLRAEIKWPNDVLLNRRKVCGILAEAVWLGSEVESVVLGIGVNVYTAAVPPPELLVFPTTSLQTEAGQIFERLSLLRDILAVLLAWRSRIGTDEFLKAWEENLAFRGEQIEVWAEGSAPRFGQVEGLDSDGGLRLRSPQGEVFSVHFGEVHLRPVV